jgi:hypothetical protein
MVPSDTTIPEVFLQNYGTPSLSVIPTGFVEAEKFPKQVLIERVC